MSTSRKLLVETSEKGRKVIDYALLTDSQIRRQIKSYEKKYGMPYEEYSRRFDCDSAMPWESGDLIEWECLVEEREERRREAGGRQKATYVQP